MGEPNINSMFLKPIASKDVVDIIKEFKAKTSTDSNDLSMSVLKNIACEISSPFTHICNLSLKNGIFPDQMKLAKVVPLFKTGENTTFNNYRPVSLLSQFSKVFKHENKPWITNGGAAFLNCSC